MREQFIIYLHGTQLEQPGWAIIGEDGKVRQHTLHDDPAGLATLASEKQVIVVVPATEVILTTASLPKLNRSRLMQALPYTLEDQLIDDVTNLHFAASEQRADGAVSAAITSHAKMQAWLALLASWQIQPEIMIPAIFAVPVKENAWNGMMSDVAVVRTNDLQGFACDNQNLPALLSAALASSAQTPLSVNIRNYSNDSLPDMKGIHIAVNEVRVPIEDFMTEVATNISQSSWLNLLQGPYAVKTNKFPRLEKLWKVAAWLAIVWVALLFLYPLVSYFILNKRLSAVDQQVAQIYKREFPQSSGIVAPQMRMQEKLQKLQAQVGDSRLLLLAGYVGEALHTASGVKLKKLDFQNSQLTLELTAANTSDFSAFTDFLTQKGLQVKQQNATLSSGHITATVQVE